ncbi:uncharacterized protein CLUP02_01250 [Colletotrichum lupini]|uniref:Uncharacterized protein n=1 Tax=Colletotrichum lupini TaxID=145971 RepID=A0A9Q8SC09_9PEZI|nr:uncharacterized protein CLUP02_01250 [Colletotrichum lupini]UQC74599.1 hypothetical protein CLUP02_01250 [Colletotrichum lupini]
MPCILPIRSGPRGLPAFGKTLLVPCKYLCCPMCVQRYFWIMTLPLLRCR